MLLIALIMFMVANLYYYFYFLQILSKKVK
ncbi:MAG: hypothetical protein JWQ34_2537 [Mucilaginibacter sp.]|nr:hypothetical protein [Mucilaginibacter sp.]